MPLSSSTRLRRVALGASALLLGACADSTQPLLAPTGGTKQLTVATLAGAPSALVKIRGGGQTTPPGTAVPIAPAVRVRDAQNLSVPGVTVVFAIASGGGSVTGATAVTDSTGVATIGSWTLGGTAGTKTLTATVTGIPRVTFTATAATASSSNVRVHVTTPTVNTVVSDTTLLVRATVGALRPLTAVTARIGGVQTTLAHLSDSTFQGTLDMHNVPVGAAGLVVRGVDTTGAATEQVVALAYDPLPVVTVLSPAVNAFSRPLTTYSATCGGSCIVLTLVNVGTGAQIAAGTSSVSGSVTLPDGQEAQLRFTATNAHGQTTTVLRTVTVEASTRLTPLMTVPALRIFDYSAGRALFWRAADDRIAVRTLAGTEATVLGVSAAAVSKAFVWFSGSQSSALVTTFPSGGSAGTLYQWYENGFVPPSVPNVNAATVSLNGNYAVYATPNGGDATRQTVVRRDMAVGNDVTVSAAASADFPQSMSGVGPNGDVVYSSSLHQIIRWRNGIATVITADVIGGFKTNRNPVTDGNIIVYLKSTFLGDSNWVTRSNGTLETRLTLNSQAASPLSGLVKHLVNNGWIAFSTQPVGEAGINLVWVWRPDGVPVGTVGFNGTIELEALGADGTMIVKSSDGHRYAANAGVFIHDIGSTLGTVLWRDGQFVLLLGNTVLKITP
jgi:hypothetical protein